MMSLLLKVVLFLTNIPMSMHVYLYEHLWPLKDALFAATGCQWYTISLSDKIFPFSLVAMQTRKTI